MQHQFRATLASLHAVGFVGGVTAWMGGAAVVFADAGQVWSGEMAGPMPHVLVGAALIGLVLGTPLRPWVLGSRSGVRGVNLIATRATATPRVWLTAHSDSKGQHFSMAGRLVLAAATGVSGILLLALAGLSLAGVPPAGGWWTLAGVVAFLAGAPLTLNGILRDSPGAVDNATGVLTVVAILDRMPTGAAIGVIVPDAEEWGLVGATALTRDHPELFRGSSIINFDGIDDRGWCTVFEHRAGSLGRGVARSLGVLPRRWLPVVVDGVAFARARDLQACVTVMRGDVGTMRIVHTRHDVTHRLTLAGVERVASRVAEALLETTRSDA